MDLTLHQKLETLKSRHEYIQRQMTLMTSLPLFDELKVQRLKRQRVKIRGEMAEIERELMPDISA